MPAEASVLLMLAALFDLGSRAGLCVFAHNYQRHLQSLDEVASL